MKFCEDCKHIVPAEHHKDEAKLIFARCSKYNKKESDYSTSKLFVKNQYCTYARTPLFGRCGYFAWGFEPK